MSTQDFIELYTSLFAGTSECFAIRWEFEADGKARSLYLPSNYDKNKEYVREHVRKVVSDVGTEKYGKEAVLAHLMGKHFLGVYPIDTDSTVIFFALDFDKEPEIAFAEALHQQRVFMAEGIRTYIERSRSGNGFHLWGFLEGRVNAGKLRYALKAFIDDADTYDRMFPNQDGTKDTKPYGNLIALPLYGPFVKEGKTVFVFENENGDPEAYPDQKEFLSKVEKIPVSKIEQLFNLREQAEGAFVPDMGGRKREGDPEGLKGIYKVTHKEMGCEWIQWCWNNPEDVLEPEWYALACQFAQLDGGREAFHEFSAQDPARYDPEATDRKFDHALEQNAPHTCQYIRDNLNGDPCTCDQRFPEYGVTHPYDLAKVPFNILMEQLNLDAEPDLGNEGLLRSIEKTFAAYRDPNHFTGWKYGIQEIDTHTELRPHDLVIVAGRPGRGKTAFMVDIAYRLARDGVNCYIYSMEMSRDQFWQRMLARMAGVDATRLRDGKINKTEMRKLIRARKYLEKYPMPIFLDDTTYDSTELVNKCSEQIAENGPGVVFIDYLQMAQEQEREGDYAKVSRVAREYKLLGKGMAVPVVALTQMNREGEDLTIDSETIDRVLEGSGKIEQYADVILIILGPRKPGIVLRVIVQHKDRHREPGHRFRLDYHQALMRFEKEGHWGRIAKAANQMSMPNINLQQLFNS